MHRRRLNLCGKHLLTEVLLTLNGTAACIMVEGSMINDLFLNYLDFTMYMAHYDEFLTYADERCF